jgi:hypothetical protein
MHMAEIAVLPALNGRHRIAVSMKRAALSAILATSIGLIAGCVKQSTYDASQAKLEDTQRQLAETQKKLSDTQSKLDQAEKQLSDTSEQLSVLKTQLSPPKPMPVQVIFRKPMGLGYVAFITTTLKRELPVTLTVIPHGPGTSKEINVVVPDSGHLELRGMDMNELEDGDQIQISSPDFEPETVTFHLLE